MARKVTVKRFMREYLEEYAGEKFEEAGSSWDKQPMGFYFPENENTVDRCALTVMKNSFESDGVNMIPDSVKRGVRELVNTNTKTGDAITTIFLGTFQPVLSNL